MSLLILSILKIDNKSYSTSELLFYFRFVISKYIIYINLS